MVDNLLETAKQNYPIGTTFKSLIDRTTKTVISDTPYGCSYICVGVKTPRTSQSTAYLYKDGKWAEIISTPVKSYELWN